jgi:hypothetical protein
VKTSSGLDGPSRIPRTLKTKTRRNHRTIRPRNKAIRGSGRDHGRSDDDESDSLHEGASSEETETSQGATYHDIDDGGSDSGPPDIDAMEPLPDNDDNDGPVVATLRPRASRSRQQADPEVEFLGTGLKGFIRRIGRGGRSESADRPSAPLET